MEKTLVNAATGCWEWQGLRNKKGYGISSSRELTGQFLHRHSFELFCEPIEPGNIVRHRCDNPPCWNPAHLVQGTYSDNLTDAIARKRKPVGSQMYNAKLTEAEVLAIRASAEPNKIIADRYGIAAPNVSSIRLRKIWKHV